MSVRKFFEAEGAKARPAAGGAALLHVSTCNLAMAMAGEYYCYSEVRCGAGAHVDVLWRSALCEVK